MSCHQVSRLITTNATTLSTSAAITTPEDPYVFTETVPATPPILFNTQKSRCRLTDSQFTLATKSTNQKLPLAQLHDNISKTQASHLPSSHASVTTTASTTTANLKNAAQSSSQNLQPKRITTNVCVVRPQLQQKLQQPQVLQQQQQQQQQHKQQKKQQTVTPLLSHTPSLWQTPLLLETAPVSIAAGNSANSPATIFLSPKPTQSTTLLVAGTTPAIPAKSLALPVSANVTATAMVSPMISPSATTLPPSKFHNTTLAQHLQKVECIKKPKKSIWCKQQPQPRNGVDKQLSTQTAPPPLHAFTEPPSATQHSDASDLNEIPVNVIFRKPQTTGETAHTLPGAGGCGTNNDAVAIKGKIGGTAPAAATTTPVVTNKLKSFKIMAPIAKTTLPATPTAPTIMQPLVVGTTAVQPVNDVIFVQPQAKLQSTDNNTALYKNNNNLKTSSKSVAISKSTDCVATPAYFKAIIPGVTMLSHNKSGKSLQTNTLYATSLPPPLCKVATVPAHTVVCTRKPKKLTALTVEVAQKKNRKPFASFFRNERALTHTKIGCGFNSTAVGVVKLSAAEVDADISLLSSATVLPYCLQQHWLNICDTKTLLDHTPVLTPNGQREDRIAQHKSVLQRQALQLLMTRSMQRLPLHAARKRLLCVDRLLHKYRNHIEKNSQPVEMCTTEGCHSRAIELTAHCEQHISNNATQHIFLPCTAKFSDNTQCRIPVFDISHDLSLCSEHARKRDAYDRNVFEQRPRKAATALPLVFNKDDLQRQWRQQQLYQQQQHMQGSCNKKKTAISATTTRVAPMRKRKSTAGSGPNPVGRPQKRVRRAPTAAINSTLELALPKSTVLKRKNSTTSLESIASNSYSSNSQPMQSLQHEYQQSASSIALSPPPALAPLSSMAVSESATRTLNFGASATMAAELKEHEINEIVTQLAMVAAVNSSNDNSNGHTINNNLNFANTNSNSNFTSSGMGSSSSLPSAGDELLTQDMLSICENSSAYASSEDTGLGGLSETELIAAAPDADEIPLADARFFFDDLANVINAMPADAFNELFTTVHQDECEEVDRALEIADKHLKTLQQTIGTESDFLGDFLNVSDDILPDATDICSKMEIVSSVMHSPETSNIDSAALFADSGSGSGSSVVGDSINNTNSASAVDIRGLLQT